MMMTDKRVLLLGATGTLGSYLSQVLPNHFTTLAPRPWADEPIFSHMGVQWLSTPLDATRPAHLVQLMDEARPDVIINCIAITPKSPLLTDGITCIAVNSLFPYHLVQAARSRGCYLIHISTDGVFSGKQGNYTEDDLPDPPDLYGRSKLLGEIIGDGCLTVRTTFWGLSPVKSGLVEWLLGQRGQTVNGYKNYIFSGLSMAALGRAIIAVVERPVPLTGLYHLGGPAVSKHDLLVTLSNKLHLGVTIIPVAEPIVNRSLDSSRFWRNMPMQLTSLSEMVDGIRSELEEKQKEYQRSAI